ncbi:MAG: hypothetical protein EA416_11370 [Trueperaceae bacterium]|nr:MAG: hypothetical protein EA416_11370 [Trueperaceae bacterium]
MRLLPRHELGALLDAFVPLAPGRRWRVLDTAGAALVERGGEAQGAADGAGVAPLLTPLTLDGEAIGTLQLAPAAPLDTGHALLRAAHSVLEQALAAASMRRELASETLERYREVHLAYRLGEVLTGGVELAALPARVLDEAVRVVQAPYALLVLDGDADEDEGGRVAAARGAEGSADGAREVVAAIRAGGAADRAGIDVDERPEAAAHAVRLWAPLRAGERTIGGLLLTRPAGSRVFSAGDAKMLSALAAQAATSIENARLHAASLEQARMARELQLAHEVQARLMPTVLPSSTSWQLAAWWSAAREVAGDFYDATRQGETTIVTVGDVADKGMAAALFMALTRSVLRASAVDGRDPGDVVTRANALLCADASDGMFVTLAHAHLASDGTVRYANAGHNPPLVARADGSLERLPRTGILVGWDDAARYGVETVRLASGDALVLYTDGVTEARDERGREYGEERLVELVREHVAARRSAAAIVSALRTDLAGFVGQADAFDDATLLVALRRSGEGVSTSQVPGT